MNRYVLDSCALLDFFAGATGANLVVGLIQETTEEQTELFVSLVNYSEVLYIAERRGRLEEVEEALRELPLVIVAPDLEQATRAAHFKAGGGIALADCFAAALADALDAHVVTRDPEFQRVEKQVDVLWFGDSAGLDID